MDRPVVRRRSPTASATTPRCSRLPRSPDFRSATRCNRLVASRFRRRITSATPTRWVFPPRSDRRRDPGLSRHRRRGRRPEPAGRRWRRAPPGSGTQRWGNPGPARTGPRRCARRRNPHAGASRRPPPRQPRATVSGPPGPNRSSAEPGPHGGYNARPGRCRRIRRAAWGSGRPGERRR